MAVITLMRIKYGWQVIQGELTLDAENPRVDRGAIRTILTVRNCTVLYYRDTVNLTSARVRARIITLLAEKKVIVLDEWLLALDEACRQRPIPAPAQKMLGGGESDFSEKVPNFLICKSILPLFCFSGTLMCCP